MDKACIVIGIKELPAYTASLKRKLASPVSLTRRISAYMEGSTKQKLRSGRIRGPKTSAFTLSVRRGSGGGISLVDNGQLFQSIGHSDTTVGSHLVYAAIHNRGGIVRAKQARYLAIPACTEAKTLAQVKGVRGALAILKKRGYAVWSTKQCIMGKKGSRARPKVLYYLKKQVLIPKQEFLYIDQTDEKVIKEEVRSWLKS